MRIFILKVIEPALAESTRANPKHVWEFETLETKSWESCRVLGLEFIERVLVGTSYLKVHYLHQYPLNQCSFACGTTPNVIYFLQGSLAC